MVEQARSKLTTDCPDSQQRFAALFGGLLLLVAATMSTMADEPSVQFLFSSSSDSTGYWPHDDMRIRAQWSVPPVADSIQCSLRNHDNLDAVDIYLQPADSLTFEGLVPFGTGWTLSTEPLPDEVLDCLYGHRITATVDDVPDSVRILVECAVLQILPDSVGVGDPFSISVGDRDQNRNLDEPESLQVMLRSVFGQGEHLITLDETGSDTGVFAANDSLIVALVEDSTGFPVLDADTLRAAMWDPHAFYEAWEPAQGESLDIQQAVETRSATIAIVHPLYGELIQLPLDDSGLTIMVEEPDLMGLDEIAVSAAIRSPSGDTVDSMTIPLYETDSGVFRGVITVGGADPDLLAATGDSLLCYYHDRADDSGEMRVVRAVSILGAEIIGGIISETQWTNENVYLLVDSAFVSAGAELAVAPGCLVAVLPDSAIAWVVEGVLTLGEEDGDSVTVRSASMMSLPGVWEGILVKGGTLVAHTTVVRDAVVGVSGTENGNIELHRCRVEENGADRNVVGELLAGRNNQSVLDQYARSGDRALPGGLSIGDANVTLNGCTVEANAGYGISIQQGNGDVRLRASRLNHNALDAVVVFSPRDLCEMVGDTMIGNGAGGAYAALADVSFDSCLIAGNAFQGVYCTGGSSEMTACTVMENLGGGVTLRDQNSTNVATSLVTRNHLFGFNIAWNCTLSMTSSVAGGNGGAGISVDYAGFFDIGETSLAHNREQAVYVGPWCTVDTLYAQSCWWGQAPPAADSTGENLEEIWDGRDEPGRAVVRFTPWLESTPGVPAPSSLDPLGGEFIRFSSTELATGDTIFVDLIPNEDHIPARYAPLAIASSSDTIRCFTIYESSQDGGVFRGRIVLVETANELTPDQLGFTDGDLNAWWLSDSTVLAAVAGQSVVPTVFELTIAPNPFRAATVFSWIASGSRPVRIEIYDLAGHRVWRSTTLSERGDLTFDETKMGFYSMPSGTYVSILRSSMRSVATRIVKLP